MVSNLHSDHKIIWLIRRTSLILHIERTLRIGKWYEHKKRPVQNAYNAIRYQWSK